MSTYNNPRTGEVVETEPRPFDQILREVQGLVPVHVNHGRP